MKKGILLLLAGAVFVTSCSKSDGGDAIDKFAGVPSGEIVAVGERNKTLTGFDEVQQKTTDGDEEQKWWEQTVAKADYHCHDMEDEDLTQEGIFYAFNPDGYIYYKVGVDGTEVRHQAWEWESDAKDAVIVQGVSFTIRALNDGSLVYASYQEQSSDCYAVTWEQFIPE